MKTPEAVVKDRIKAFLKDRGVYYFLPVQTGYGATTLDIIACIRGRFVGIEVKRKGITQPSPRQKICMENIEAAGGWAFCVDSLDKLVEGLNAKAGGSFW